MITNRGEAPIRIQAPIVGAYFHPPAKALLEHAPNGAPLLLQRNPENPYDPNAISVWLRPSAIPESQHPDLIPKLQGFGLTLAEFLESPLWTLGFIAAKPPKDNPAGWCSATITPLLAHRNLPECPATLYFSPDGKPYAQLQLAPSALPESP